MSDREVLYLHLVQHVRVAFPPRVFYFISRWFYIYAVLFAWVISEESLEDSQRVSWAGTKARSYVTGTQPKPVADAAPAKSI